VLVDVRLQTAAVENRASLGEVAGWTLANNGGQESPTRALGCREVEFLVRCQNREFVASNAKDSGHSLMP